MLRIVIGVILGFAAAALGGKVLIPFLRRMKAGQSIKEIGPTWHMSKQGTPTMGGLMFIIAAAAVTAVLGWPDFMAGRFGGAFVLLFALVFGIIGYIDDYMKVKHHQNTGLTAPQKFLLQLAAAILFTVLMRSHGYLSPVLYLPFFDVNLALPWPVYMVFAAFVMVGTVNAVNITDGIDGLAAGVTIPVMAFFTVLAWYWQHLEIGLFSGALMGGLFGFLLYNFHPAKVFMGDTGSLFMGGMVCALAFGMDLPLLLLPVGFVYLCEILSVVLQVTYFKATHGKRLFKMSPIHHHFEMCGWGEKKIVFVFAGITVVMCILSWMLVA